MVQAPVRVRSVEETIDDGFVADDRQEIIAYLRENDDLLPVLERIKDRVHPPLLAPMPLRLILSYDPEWEDDPSYLLVKIPTELDADPVVDALYELERAWWTEEWRRFGDRLILMLDFV